MKLNSISRYPDPAHFTDIRDLSIVASVQELRALASFFAHAAERAAGEAEEMAPAWHLHWRDQWPAWTEDMSDLIVSLPSDGSASNDD